jgi:hypothetical protein
VISRLKYGEAAKGTTRYVILVLSGHKIIAIYGVNR